MPELKTIAILDSKQEIYDRVSDGKKWFHDCCKKNSQKIFQN